MLSVKNQSEIIMSIPSTAVKVINHLGDEVMKVFRM
jgi:hypothetical protein